MATKNSSIKDKEEIAIPVIDVKKYVQRKKSEKAKGLSVKSIIDLTPTKARKYFLTQESYFNRKLPPYFKFSKLLNQISEVLQKSKLSDFFDTNLKPHEVEQVNYKLLDNKDGEYAWRLFQLINPAIYVSLVHKMTEKESWDLITNKLKEHKKNNVVNCVSLPVIPHNLKQIQKKQILQWWEEVEQQSLVLSLEYKYLFHTDITNCYGSIYTHSIPWSLHGKDEAKNKRKDQNLLGNVIDLHLQNMSHGQTNGIPEGSNLMDFIAELVLGYIDASLSIRLTIPKDTYQIIRYRDDYRIFVNNPEVGKNIIKELTGILSEMKMSLSTDKTKVSNNVIQDSIKKDKLYWIKNEQNEYYNLQKQLLLLHDLSLQFPHSGTIEKELQKFLKKIKNRKRKVNEKEAHILISIIVDIAYHNPKVYPVTSAILSDLLDSVDSNLKADVISKIRKKFSELPNTEYLDLWLQRITIKMNTDLEYKGSLCKLMNGESNNLLWNISWLKEGCSLRKIIEDAELVDKKVLNKLSSSIGVEEVSIFDPYYA
jgi:hypothetical protein